MALHRVPIVGFLADLLCPERCAACSALVAPAHLFCTRCLATVHRLGPPECPCCGCPTVEPAACATCAVATSAPLRSARAWASYERTAATSPIARAIASFKYHGAQRLGPRLAAAMVTRVAHRDVSTVVPVPLHPRRLRERGFNQSAVLARHIGRIFGCRVALTAVVRQRNTPSQVALPLHGRAANVSGAFAVAEALRTAGAAAVDALTIARVL